MKLADVPNEIASFKKWLAGNSNTVVGCLGSMTTDPVCNWLKDSIPLANNERIEMYVDGIDIIHSKLGVVEQVSIIGTWVDRFQGAVDDVGLAGSGVTGQGVLDFLQKHNIDQSAASVSLGAGAGLIPPGLIP